MNNFWQWTGCELTKAFTKYIEKVNGKEHFIFLLILQLFLDGLYQSIPGT